MHQHRDEFPERGDGGVGLLAQPLAELGLVGELLDAGQVPHERFAVEPFGVGQAGAARTERIEELGDDEFRAGAVGDAGARVQSGPGADFFPEIELLSQGLEGGQPAEGGLLWGRDELEAEAGRALEDGRYDSSPLGAGRSSKRVLKNFTRQGNPSGHGYGLG